MLTNPNIFLVTQDDALAMAVHSNLADTDMNVERVKEQRELGDFGSKDSPVLVLFDGAAGETELLKSIETLRSRTDKAVLGILVLITEADDQLIASLLSAGADDVASRNLHQWGFAARIHSQLARLETARDLSLKINDSLLLVEVTSKLVGAGDLFDNLFSMVTLLSKELDVARCSVVLVRSEGDFGLVIASSDDANIKSLPINLGKYPEIKTVARIRNPLIIPDIACSDLHDDILDNLKNTGVISIALFPIARNDEFLGVIFLRFTRRRDAFEPRELVFCQTVANATAIALRNNEILENLKAKEVEVEHVQNQALKQLKALKSYEDFFQSSMDGMVVLSDTWVVLFVNPKGAAMIGLPESSIRGFPFTKMISKADCAKLESLVANNLSGKRCADFSFALRDDDRKIISISAGPLGKGGMTLLTMREVTEDRTTAKRLAEARERLIRSEKKSAMMEVAGAAAHELNQPLTSIMTSVAMLKRLLPKDATRLLKLVATMDQESERMAAIIRRLSKLTEYSTKSYVGSARIIDLDQVSADLSDSDTEN